jgi:hypothetical protein
MILATEAPGGGRIAAMNERTPVAAALFIALLLLWTPAARAQEETPNAKSQDVPTASEADAGEEAATLSASQVAAEFSDPLTTLPQIFLKDSYTPENEGTDARTNRLTARVIVPRVPGSSLLPFPQLIRPSVSLVTVPTGKGNETRTEFGDMQLFDLGVLPWSDWKKKGFLMGVGPTFVFPTATDNTAGQGAWQVGPALGAIYKGIPGVLLGCLVQNPISFAYTSNDRQSVNQLLFQPILLAYLGHGFYVKSADSTWVRGWNDHSPTLLPVSLGLGYVLLREGWPPVNAFVSGEWMAWRDDAPVAPKATVNFGLTVAFPQWRPW